jgi:two-component system phosphate regulon sensor histidine kinase PhoR
LREREIDPATRDRLLEVIDTESTRLAGLVEEILLASQLDADRLTLTRTVVDAHAIVAAAVPRGAEVVVEIADDTPPIAADPEKLRQVLANLIENALKYGRAPVAVRARGVRTRVRVEVSDSGDGVPRPEQLRIFEKFYRLEQHLHEGVRGTGLGLYICRELVHRMHGQIGVDSTHGRGATFWVELPRG